jgi:DNA-binding GntR family transcriptional regulator
MSRKSRSHRGPGSGDDLRATRPAALGAFNRLSDLVAEQLKEMILDGAVEPGDPIVVVDIGRQFGVSRQPVMEALKRIETDGAIEILPQVGCRVRRPGAREVEDFFQMFAAMEAELSALAAERRSETEAATFSNLLASLLRTLDRSKSAPVAPPNHRRVNRAFHGAIHEMAGSPVVARLASTLWDRSDFYVKAAFGVFHINSRVRAAYTRIGEAILARDTNAARAATHRHLITSGRAAGERLRAAVR